MRYHRNEQLVSIIFKRDDDAPDQMTVTRRQALRIAKLAESKALPRDAVMNVIAGRVHVALEEFLKHNGV